MKTLNIKRIIKKNTIWIIFLAIMFIFSIMVDGFLSLNNLGNVFRQNCEKGVMAIGMTFLIINGYFDLSVGTLMGLTCALTIGLQAATGTIPAILISLVVGFAVGALNGFLVTRVGLNAFAVTLASMLGVRGVLYMFTQEKSLVGHDEAFADFGSGSFLGINNYVIIFVLLLIIAQLVLRYSRHGRNTYATGGNELVAANAGINTKRTTMINFIICSMAATFGGILYAAGMNAATPTLGWPDTHMTIIAIVVLGGTKLAGGYGNMFFTLGGLLSLGFIQNAMNLLNVQSYYNSLLTGTILILVLYLDKVIRPEKIN